MSWDEADRFERELDLIGTIPAVLAIVSVLMLLHWLY